MKIIGIWTALAVFAGNYAHANSYRFTVTSPDMTKLSQAKNCIDYLLCVPTQTSLNSDAKRMHVWAELPNDQAALAVLRSCDFSKQGVVVTLMNESSNAQTTSLKVAATSDLLPTLKNLYLPTLTAAQKSNLESRLKQLFRANKKNEAIQLVVAFFGMNTYGYRMYFDPTIPEYAITDHTLKTIGVGSGFFDNACDFIRGVRHELEHVAQVVRSDQCAIKGVQVSLEDHVERERSAHLNDLANLSRYCDSRQSKKDITSSVWNRLLNNYLKP